ncbi:MAG TPA: hypothetical protein VF821_19525, partial [Lentzea sp.]
PEAPRTLSGSGPTGPLFAALARPRRNARKSLRHNTFSAKASRRAELPEAAAFSSHEQTAVSRRALPPKARRCALSGPTTEHGVHRSEPPEAAT